MKYGCIGERLGHSFSKEVHSALNDYEYQLCEVARDDLDSFMVRQDFTAINVTIPYKERVIPHLKYIDGHAEAIGAVNTVVNRGDGLYGYNTDFYGLERLLAHAGVDPKGKKIIILGTGGTSKTAYAVSVALGATEVIKVSRNPTEGEIGYDRLYSHHTDADILINTTPIGMYPDCYCCPVELSKFHKLSGVIDAVYNPLRTVLVSEAKMRGIPAEGGLYMLVAQGVRASEIFLDTVYPKGELDRVFNKILSSKENIVLIGMPASGKTSVGGIIAKALGREFIDTDSLVENEMGMTIPEIFARLGEEAFRDAESRAVRLASSKTSSVIATGGGAILRPENVAALKQNGRVYFLDRSTELLIPTSDRPLALDRKAIEERYKERYPIYTSCADAVISADGSACDVANQIIEKHGVDKI